MIYTTTINDESVPGITAARNAYNTSIPATVTENEVEIPNPALLPSTAAYLDFVLKNAIDSWNRQYAQVIVPEIPVTVVNGVPQSVSFRQAKQELIVRGFWDQIVTYVDSIPDPIQKALTATEVYDSQTYERQRPALVNLAKGLLALTDTQIDDLFIQAATR